MSVKTLHSEWEPNQLVSTSDLRIESSNARKDPSSVQATAGAVSGHVSHLGNHCSSRGRQCRSPPWSFEIGPSLNASRRRATSAGLPSRTDPITFRHPGETTYEDRGMFQRMPGLETKSPDGASTPGFRRSPSAGPRFCCTAGTWSPRIGGDSTPRVMTISPEEAHTMKVAMKVHGFPGNAQVMGITGAEDLRLGMKKCVKSDLPLSDTATRQMDKRMLLASFAGCRQRGGNQQIVESTDTFHCFHHNANSVANVAGGEPRTLRRMQPSGYAATGRMQPAKDPLRNYRDAGPATPPVTLSRGCVSARGRS